MKISRNNIAFSTIRSKMMRSRRTKYNTSKTNNSAKARAATLAQKNEIMAQSGKRKTSLATTMLESTKSNYTAMKSAAQDVQTYLEHLMSEKEGSLFQKAETSGDTAAIVSEVKSFVDDYNTMVRKMNSEGGTVNELYVKQLHGFVVSHKSKLENIGITEDKNGLLTVDRNKLEAADLEKLKNVFQGENSFAQKVADRSKKVEENADTNLNSLNSATYSSILANYGISGSKYNFLA
ncbi:MAG: hypothetical protein K2K54_07520 [Lachnospiraceae bacterium]|nr:hypothetical protein [Lachnospiraceae bacterium]